MFYRAVLLALLVGSSASGSSLAQKRAPKSHESEIVPKGFKGIATLEPMPKDKDLFPGYEHAPFIANYYVSEGISTYDRYSYEVIVVDSLVVTVFNSPSTESWHNISYLRKRILSDPERAALAKAFKAAHLKQRFDGMPRPTFSGYGEDVLIVRAPKMHIAGGRVYSFVEGDSADSPQVASSLGGNVTLVARAMMKLFPMLDTLMGLSRCGHDLPEVIGNRPLKEWVLDSAVDNDVRTLVNFERQDGPDRLDSAGNQRMKLMDEADSTTLVKAAQAMLRADSLRRLFYFRVLTYHLDEGEEALSDGLIEPMYQFVLKYPSDFLNYFATDSSLQFGQLDDWAQFISRKLQGKTKGEYDTSELAFEQEISRISLAKPQHDILEILLDRLRDIKHNREERMERQGVDH